MSRFTRVALILLLATAALPAVVNAQPLPQYRAAPRIQTSPGFESGYTRGLRAGDEDGRRREAFRFADEADYRRADFGYQRRYGLLDRYRGEFRRGFEIGYRVGYERRIPRGPQGQGRGRYGAPGLGQRADLALDYGFADGFSAGVEDARRQRNYDPFGEGRYRSGDRGYERWYGPREAYRVNYRNAFRRGYDEGYREVLRHW